MDNIEKIEAYLDGTLKGEELAKFETSLANDPNLQEDLDLYKEIKDTVLEDDVLQLKETLTEIASSQSKVKPLTPSRSNRITFLYLATAACFAIILAFVILYNFSSPEKSNEELFTTYYEAYPPESAVRGSIDSATLQEIMSWYADGSFEEAIYTLDSLISENPTNYKLQMYLGHSYILSGQYEKSLQVLNRIPEDSRFYYDAVWFSALTFIVKGDRNSAKEKLLQLRADNNSYYKNKVNSLLEDL
ncbi:MAG: tetratricopeptide repeat protein [Bacteroidota bacterium]